MVPNYLWEYTDAFEAPIFLRAHVVQTKVDGFGVNVHGEVFEDFLRPVMGEGVGVCAGGAFGKVHDAGGVVIRGHVWDVAEVDSVVGRGGGGVVFHEETSVVIV